MKLICAKCCKPTCLNQVIAELGKELAQPSGRLKIPLQGLISLLGDEAPPSSRPADDGTAGPTNSAPTRVTYVRAQEVQV
jgi:hypothetical protein